MTQQKELAALQERYMAGPPCSPKEKSVTPEEWEAKVHDEGDMWPAPGEIAAVIREAVEAEREACAALAEAYAEWAKKHPIADVDSKVIAKLIRARSNPCSDS